MVSARLPSGWMGGEDCRCSGVEFGGRQLGTTEEAATKKSIELAKSSVPKMEFYKTRLGPQ